MSNTVIPAGLELRAAAGWVGQSAWVELWIFERLTALLAKGELSPTEKRAVWRIRSHRGEAAEAWHKRLPELREMPRKEFMAGDAALSELLESQSVNPSTAGVVKNLLTVLADRYSAYQPVAVGPADGPTAETLQNQIRVLETDLQALTLVTPGI